MNDTGRNDTTGLGWLAAAAAAATYALIVFGGVVRITGSGMGCGDDWPLCNGELIPPMDFETLIEYGHRLAAVGVSLLVVSLAAVAGWPRRAAVGRPLRRLAGLAVLLLVVQVLLGAVTVWLELPPATVVLHFGTALGLLAVLTISACLGLAGEGRPARLHDRAARFVTALAAYVYGVALLGALVANLDAGPACLGFPACNGSWLPGGSGLVHVHWTHRVAAYLLIPPLIALPLLVAKWRPRDRAALGWSALALVVGIGQIGVAAAMVLALFPSTWRAVHLGMGAALFGILVVTAWLAARPRAPG
jgi:heme A synthase